jgi:hypothetical protein
MMLTREELNEFNQLSDKIVSSKSTSEEEERWSQLYRKFSRCIDGHVLSNKYDYPDQECLICWNHRVMAEADQLIAKYGGGPSAGTG